MQKTDKNTYYDWQRTLSYNADINMIITSRGRGKTFGLREMCVKDFKRDGKRFVEVCRFKNEIADVMQGYYDKLTSESPECKGYIFKTERYQAFIAQEPQTRVITDKEGNTKEVTDKPKWETIGYFVDLFKQQKAKKKTFANVRRVIFDEAVLDDTTAGNTYLRNEWTLLSNLIDSIAREDAAGADAKERTHLYLLGNSCDLLNPYFIAAGIKKEPHFGYSWHMSKLFLLHYEQPGDYAEAKAKNTLAGRMLSRTRDGMAMINNKFINNDTSYIANKTPNAKYEYGLKYRGDVFGVWLDWQEGYCFINTKTPKNTDKPLYALSVKDDDINYILARRITPALKSLAELKYTGVVYYDNIGTKDKLNHIFELLGIK